MKGKYEKTSLNVRRALELVEEEVNDKLPFRTPSDGNISLKITIHDDESSVTKVETLYKEMLDSGEFDFFLGPYSSGLSRKAAEILDNSSKVLMQHQAADPSIYVTEDGSPRFRYVFAANPMATDYYTNGLRHLWSVGARTMIVARGTAAFHNALCDGAIKNGREIGFEVLEDFSIDPEDLTTSIRKSRGLIPDVFVGCGHLSDVISIAVTSRALMFNPKALFMSTATSASFVTATESKNANYVLGPVSWAKDLIPDEDAPRCRVFGSNTGFFDKYKARWGSDPTYHSAMAAIAVIAMMSAAEFVGVPQPDSDSTRAALLSMEIPTFAAMLRFNETGQRHGVVCATEQIFPYSSAVTPAERFTQSEFRLITSENPPVFPAPTWEQRELEVYPCSLGLVRNRSSADPSSCEICPIGRSRNNASLICRSCPVSTYNEQSGMAECKACTDGMNCTLEDLDEYPQAAAGYYRLWHKKQSTYIYEKCDPPELCLGSNQCAGVNQGVLCAQCPRGHTSMGWGSVAEIRGLCRECPGDFIHSVWVVVLIAIYTGFIVGLSISDHLAAHSLGAIHTVIFKIMINYGHFMSIMLAATDYPFLDKAPPIRLACEFIFSPLQSMLSFDCVADAFNIRADQSSIIIGFLLIPVGLATSWCMFFVFACCLSGKVKRRRKRKAMLMGGAVPGFFEVETTVFREKSHMTRTTMTSKMATRTQMTQRSQMTRTQMTQRTSRTSRTQTGAISAMLADPEEDSDSGSDTNSDASLFSGPGDEETEKEASGSVLAQALLWPLDRATGSGSISSLETLECVSTEHPGISGQDRVRMDAPGKKQKLRDLELLVEIRAHLRVLWTRTSVISIFILHPVAMRMLLDGIYCVQLDTVRLRRNLDIVCADSEHSVWLVAGFLFLLLYGLGIPVMLGHTLYQLRHRLLDITVRRRFGFLFNGFQPNRYNFEAWYMLRKLLMLFAACIPDLYIRVLAMLFFSFLFLAAQIFILPFDKRGYFVFNQLETLSLVALVLSLAMRLGLELRRTLTGEMVKILNHPAFELPCIVITGAVHLWFWVLAVWSIFTNVYIRHLLFRKECLPATLTHLQLFLCKLVPWQRMRQKGQYLEIEKLSHSERALLGSCLSMTLVQYFKSHKLKERERRMNASRSNLEEPETIAFHPEYLRCAIREAFHRCERARIRKLKQLLHARKDTLKFDGGASESHNIANWSKIIGDKMNEDLLARAARHFVTAGGITVEEFQISLMVSWPEIAQGQHRYFQVDSWEEKEAALNEEASTSRVVWSAKRGVSEMFDMLDRREHHFCTFEDALAEVQAKEKEEEELKIAREKERVVRKSLSKDTFNLLGFEIASADEYFEIQSSKSSEALDRKRMEKRQDEMLLEVVQLQERADVLKKTLVKRFVALRPGGDKAVLFEPLLPRAQAALDKHNELFELFEDVSEEDMASKLQPLAIEHLSKEDALEHIKLEETTPNEAEEETTPNQAEEAGSPQAAEVPAADAKAGDSAHSGLQEFLQARKIPGELQELQHPNAQVRSQAQAHDDSIAARAEHCKEEALKADTVKVFQTLQSHEPEQQSSSTAPSAALRRALMLADMAAQELGPQLIGAQDVAQKEDTAGTQTPFVSSRSNSFSAPVPDDGSSRPEMELVWSNIPALESEDDLVDAQTVQPGAGMAHPAKPAKPGAGMAHPLAFALVPRNDSTFTVANHALSAMHSGIATAAQETALPRASTRQEI